MTSFRLVVVGDAATTRDLSRMLSENGELDVSVESTVEQALARHSATDVLLIDLESAKPDPAVIADLIRVSAPTRIVILAPSLDDPALSVGGGYDGRVVPVVNDVGPDELVALVRRAADATAGRLVEPRLTQRERDVLSLVAAGLTNRQVARRLAIAESTVKVHLTRIYRAIGASGRAQAAEWSRGQRPGRAPDSEG